MGHNIGNEVWVGMGGVDVVIWGDSSILKINNCSNADNVYPQFLLPESLRGLLDRKRPVLIRNVSLSIIKIQYKFIMVGVTGCTG